MGRYTYSINRTHTFTCDDTITVTVEAGDEHQAREMAREKAFEESRPRSREADHEDTAIDAIDLERHDPDDGEAPVPIRCDRTRDMFWGMAA